MIRYIAGLACCLSLSSCGYHDYTVAAQAIAEAQMRSEERMVELAAAAGKDGNVAGAMAAGYMIGSRACNRGPGIEAPSSGADYLNAFGKTLTTALGFFGIDTAGDVLIEGFRAAGGSVQAGGDIIGGDYAPVEEIVGEE